MFLFIYRYLFILKIINPQKYGQIGKMLAAAMKNSQNLKKIKLDGLNLKYTVKKIIMMMINVLYAQKQNY